MSIYSDGIPFTPETGRHYRHINGIVYECRAGRDPDGSYDTGNAWMVSPDGVAFKAVQCRYFPDGSIDWAYILYEHIINQ